MNGRIFDASRRLHGFAKACEEALLREHPVEFLYPKECFGGEWPTELIKRRNDAIFSSITEGAHVYAIRVLENNVWRLVYIEASKSLRQRIGEHMIEKNGNMGSRIDDVKTIVRKRRRIAVSYIEVKPESLCGFVEEKIISSTNPPWNKHGKPRECGTCSPPRRASVEELDRIAMRCADLPARDERSADEIIGYDEYGLPT